MGRSHEQGIATSIQEWDVGYCPPLTTQESDRLQVYLQGKIQCPQLGKYLQGTTHSKRIRSNVQSRLQGVVCPGGKDDGYLDSHCSRSCYRVEAPSHVHEERVPSRRIRRGNLHDSTTGFESSNHSKAICRLKKLLYGHKQGLRAWYSKITQYLHQIGFHTLKLDNSLYVRSESDNSICHHHVHGWSRHWRRESSQHW